MVCDGSQANMMAEPSDPDSINPELACCQAHGRTDLSHIKPLAGRAHPSSPRTGRASIESMVLRSMSDRSPPVGYPNGRADAQNALPPLHEVRVLTLEGLSP